MRAARIVLGLAGVVLAVVGFRYLLAEDWSDLVDAVIWLGGGVLVHDGLLAPVTLVVMAVGCRFLPDWLRGPATLGLVVLATVTIAAIPVLGRFGARADNPTLLDRNYIGGWAVFAAIVVVAVALGAARRRRRPPHEEVRS